MRLHRPPTLRARQRASVVLPRPGTSSISRCPSASRAASAIRISSGLPLITCWTLAAMAAATSAGLLPFTVSSLAIGPHDGLGPGHLGAALLHHDVDLLAHAVVVGALRRLVARAVPGRFRSAVRVVVGGREGLDVVFRVRLEAGHLNMHQRAPRRLAVLVVV